MRLPNILLILAASFLSSTFADEAPRLPDLRSEAQALVEAGKWDEAATAYLRLASAQVPGWEGDARIAQACAGRAAAARGDAAAARAAYLQVLQEDPAQPVAKAGLEALDAPLAPLPLPELKPEPARVEAAPAPEVPETDAGTLLDEAVALGRLGRFLEARENLRLILRLQPGHAKALVLLAELNEHLARQSERAFRRHDRPETEPIPSEELPFLLRDERARREARLPGDAPPAPPRRISPEVTPPEEPEKEKPEKQEDSESGARRADFMHARARAWSLAKAEAFDQAMAAFEALLAAHPEGRKLVEKDLKDLEEIRRKAEARHGEEAAQAERESLEAARARAAAEKAAVETHRLERVQAARALRADGDLTGALAAFQELDRLHPDDETAKALREIPGEIAAAAAGVQGKTRDEALASAHAHLAAGRHQAARQALQPLGGDHDAQDLLTAISQDETVRAKAVLAEAESRREEGRRARHQAIEEALILARSDPRAARARLYLLQKQEPDDAETAEALRAIDAIEAAGALPPPPPSPPVPMEVRQAEALERLKVRQREESCDRTFEEGRSLYYGGRLEEARRNFRTVAELSPGSRGVERYLSRIDKALRERRALGVTLPAAGKPEPEPPAVETVDARYRRAMMLYGNEDLDPAEVQLKALQAEGKLGWWKGRKVSKALGEIVRRKERSRIELAQQSDRNVSEREDRALREIEYFLDAGRKEEAFIALRGLMAGPPLSEDAQKRTEVLKARLEGR